MTKDKIKVYKNLRKNTKDNFYIRKNKSNTKEKID